MNLLWTIVTGIVIFDSPKQFFAVMVTFPVSLSFRGPILMQSLFVRLEDTMSLLLSSLLILSEGLGLPLTLKQASTVDPSVPDKMSDCLEMVGLANCAKRKLSTIVIDNLVK